MSIENVDLNLLFVLHVVLRERNVARAAERLHVTPSAVSNSLARLRDLLGDPLVTRKGRGVVPTPRALELAPAIARAMAEIEGVVRPRSFDAVACTRAFTLAVADAGQIVWVPRIAAAMARAMPCASLRVVGIEAMVVLGDLGEAEVDVHIGRRAKGPGVHAEGLFEERLVLVARRNNLVLFSGGRNNLVVPSRQDNPVGASGAGENNLVATSGSVRGAKGRRARHVTLRRLAAVRHVRVVMLPARRVRDPVDTAYQVDGVPREVVLTVPSFASAAAVAAASDLVATLPESYFLAHGEALGLVEVAGPVPKHRVEMALCWHERTHGDPAAVAFRALVRGALTSGDEPG